MQPLSPWMSKRTPLDVNVAYVEGREEVDKGNSHQSLTQDFFMVSSGKRKRDGAAAQYQNGQHIPQQDGAVDPAPEAFEGMESPLLVRHEDTLAKGSKSKIPQVDGLIPDPYNEMLSTPNIYNYHGVVTEDYNVANTPAPNEVQAGTPAVGIHADVGDEDDDDEPPLNEDDDDDLDDVDQGEELNTQHLVLAQFDNVMNLMKAEVLILSQMAGMSSWSPWMLYLRQVTRTESRWKCTLNDGIMHINNRDILFNKVGVCFMLFAFLYDAFGLEGASHHVQQLPFYPAGHGRIEFLILLDEQNRFNWKDKARDFIAGVLANFS